MNATLIITVPGKLPRALSPNGREHWTTKKRVRDQVQRDTALAFAAVAVDQAQTVRLLMAAETIVVNWTIGRSRRQRTALDDDNVIASTKYYRDTIARAIGVDDRVFRTGTVVQIEDPEGIGFVQAELCPDGVKPRLRQSQRTPGPEHTPVRTVRAKRGKENRHG